MDRESEARVSIVTHPALHQYTQILHEFDRSLELAGYITQQLGLYYTDVYSTAFALNNFSVCAANGPDRLV